MRTCLDTSKRGILCLQRVYEPIQIPNFYVYVSPPPLKYYITTPTCLTHHPTHLPQYKFYFPTQLLRKNIFRNPDGLWRYEGSFVAHLLNELTENKI